MSFSLLLKHRKYIADFTNDDINNIVREETKDYNIEFRERLVNFAVDIIKFLYTIPKNNKYNFCKLLNWQFDDPNADISVILLSDKLERNQRITIIDSIGIV